MKLTDMIGNDINKGDKVSLALPFTIGEVVAIHSGDLVVGGAPQIPAVTIQIIVTFSSPSGIIQGITLVREPKQ
jgi:hypothetical protein